MKIRKLKSSEIKIVADIIRLNYNQYTSSLALPELAAMFGSKMFSPNYLVAEEQCKIVGLAGYIQDWIDYNVYGIFWVNVAPAHQRQGIGKLLIKKTIQTLKKKGGQLIILTTRKPKFYRQFDFKSVLAFRSTGKVSRGKITHFMVLRLK